MSNREKAISETRGYVVSVCALIGVGGILSLTNSEHFPFLKISAVAFGLAILIAVTHVGILYWEDLYRPTATDDNVGLCSWRVRGSFTLMLFVILVAVGQIPVILHAILA